MPSPVSDSELERQTSGRIAPRNVIGNEHQRTSAAHPFLYRVTSTGVNAGPIALFPTAPDVLFRNSPIELAMRMSMLSSECASKFGAAETTKLGFHPALAHMKVTVRLSMPMPGCLS
jgi:hypothetical protein